MLTKLALATVAAGTLVTAHSATADAWRGPAVHVGVRGPAWGYRAPVYRAPVYRAPVYRAPVYSGYGGYDGYSPYVAPVYAPVPSVYYGPHFRHFRRW
jgi:hypothetical protein